MSNRRKPLKAVRGHGPAPEPGPGEEYFTHVAVIADRIRSHDEIDNIRTELHDALIAQLGPRRRSGVWWTHHPAKEGLEVYRTIHGDAAADEAVEMLANPRSLLVAAWAIAAALNTTCPCCATNGTLTGGPLVPGELVKTMCDPCISAAFLSAGTHPHPMGTPC